MLSTINVSFKLKECLFACKKNIFRIYVYMCVSVYHLKVFFLPSGGSNSKESTCNVDTWVQSLGWEDPLGKGMATHSSILAWRIPMDRVRHN